MPETTYPRPRVYIAGPIHGSGTQAKNMAFAMRAAARLQDEGCAVFIPNLWFPYEVFKETLEENNQEDWMQMDFAWLRQCHAMVRLPGESPGADREEDFCAQHSIPVFKQGNHGAASGEWDAGINLFLAELHSGRFDAHKREFIDATTREVAKKPEPQLASLGDGAIDNFQHEVKEWLAAQPFGPNQETWEPLAGMVEELGELAHAHLKQHQNIRGSSSKHEEDGKDAIGDLAVYMAGYCVARGWSMEECIYKAWSQVKRRDWNKNPTNGKVD